MKQGEWNIKPLQLELLKVFRACEQIIERHGLRYYATAGTLLGAVRHGDFIPWDDDFDILMPKDDFIRFLDYAQEELPEEYSINRGGRNGPVYFTKIKHEVEGIEERLSRETNLRIEFKPFLDIFYLEGMPENILTYGKWVRRRQFWRLCQVYRYPVEALHPAVRKSLKGWVMRIVGFFVSIFYPRTNNHDDMMSLLDKIENQRRFDDSFLVVEPAFFKNRFRRVVPRFYFEPARVLRFGEGTIRIPAMAEAYLTILFGDYNVLPPEELRVPEHLFHISYQDQVDLKIK